MASCLSAGFDFSHPLLVFLHVGSFLQVVWGFCFAPEALLSLLSHSLSYHLVAHRVGFWRLSRGYEIMHCGILRMVRDVFHGSRLAPL